MEYNQCATKAIKLKLNKGKRYMLCNCSKSAKLPLCDGSHRRDQKCTIKPTLYNSTVNKEVYFCGCRKKETMQVCSNMT